MKFTPILLSAALLAGCATAMVGTTPPAPAAAIPATPLDMGDWRRATAAAELTSFQDAVTHRYGAGLAVSDVVADLRRAQFTCTPNRDTVGIPPVQICRKTLTEAGCTHTWQVHLFGDADAERLSHPRGLYDRRCGNDGLLGGPN